MIIAAFAQKTRGKNSRRSLLNAQRLLEVKHQLESPATFQLSPHATPFVPMGQLPLPGGLPTPEVQLGAQETSPPNPIIATPPETHEPLPPAAEVENSIFYFSPGESTDTQALV